MALRMVTDQRYAGAIMQNQNLRNDMQAYMQGSQAFANYTGANYDSSADYWRLVAAEDGSFGWQEDGNLDFNVNDLPEDEIERIEAVLELEGRGLTADGRIVAEDMNSAIINIIRAEALWAMHHQLIMAATMELLMALHLKMELKLWLMQVLQQRH